MPTISSSDSSTRLRPDASWRSCARGLKEFSLSLHPDKTRLIEFGRFAAANRKRRGLGKPETFNFLGFTFISGKSRRGKILVKRKNRRDRMRGKLKVVRPALWGGVDQGIPARGE